MARLVENLFSPCYDLPSPPPTRGGAFSLPLSIWLYMDLAQFSFVPFWGEGCFACPEPRWALISNFAISPVQLRSGFVNFLRQGLEPGGLEFKRHMAITAVE